MRDLGSAVYRPWTARTNMKTVLIVHDLIVRRALQMRESAQAVGALLWIARPFSPEYVAKTLTPVLG